MAATVAPIGVIPFLPAEGAAAVGGGEGAAQAVAVWVKLQVVGSVPSSTLPTTVMISYIGSSVHTFTSRISNERTTIIDKVGYNFQGGFLIQCDSQSNGFIFVV